MRPFYCPADQPLFCLRAEPPFYCPAERERGIPRFARDSVFDLVQDDASGCHPSARKCRGTPRLTPQGNGRRVCPKNIFIFLSASVSGEAVKKTPYSVLPSVSEASPTSFGTALRDGIKSKLRATAEELAQKHFRFSPLWLTKGGMGLKF